MDTEASFRDAQKNKPVYFNPQQYGSSGIFFGASSNFNQPYPPMYNSFFGGQPTNPMGYQQPPSFLFRERKGRVNWRNIANLDIDDLVGRGDIKALEAHLSNITFANIEREDLEKFGDATLLKLFRLTQYGLEYLLNCQNYLSSQTQAMDNQYRSSQEMLLPLEEQARRNQSEIVNLKSEVKQKKELLKAYQNTLSTPLFKCHLCSKFFKDQGYLDTHFARRHAPQPPKQEEVILQKIVTKDSSTSPTVVPRAAGRYRQAYAEDEYQDNIPKPESTAQSQQIQQSTLMYEKLLSQLRQNDGLQLSQLTTTIQDRLDEVLESNKALTAKVSELEKKLETQSLSPERVKPYSAEKEFVTTDKRTYEPANQFVSTSKKNYEDASTSPRNGLDQTLKRGTSGVDRNNTMEDLQRKVTPKKLSLKDKMSTGAAVQVYHAGSLQDVQEEVPAVAVKTVWPYKQAFKAGSINDVVDVEEGEEKEKSKANQLFYIYPKTQVFRAGELEAYQEDISQVSTGLIKQLTEPPQVQEKWIEVKLQVLRAGDIENARDEQRQVFNAGDLRGDIDTREDLGLIHSLGLEEDEDSMRIPNDRKFSQGDFVIMEQEEEDDHDLLDEEEGELDADQLREKHKNLVTKANQLIRNKYRGRTAKEDEEARKKLKKEINKLSKQLYQMKYKKMPEQKTEELEEILTDLKRLNKQNYQELKFMEIDIKNAQQRRSVEPEKVSSKAKPSQETGKRDAIDSKNNKVMQSGELMNLLMTQGGRERESGSSQDPSSMRKQVFESQNLEMQLGSMEDVKKSGSFVPKNKLNVRDSGTDLVKKSIEIGIAEQL